MDGHKGKLYKKPATPQLSYSNWIFFSIISNRKCEKETHSNIWQRFLDSIIFSVMNGEQPVESWIEKRKWDFAKFKQNSRMHYSQSFMQILAQVLLKLNDKTNCWWCYNAVLTLSLNVLFFLCMHTLNDEVFLLFCIFLMFISRFYGTIFTAHSLFTWNLGDLHSLVS